MRLDVYLVKKKLVSTRSKAKSAILRGLVKVDGKTVREPDFRVTNENVEVTDRYLAEMPSGYFKLKRLIEEEKIVEKGDTVIDLGSSSGGFLLAASEIASSVYGFEISPEFREALENIRRKRKNVRVFFENVFTVDPDVVPENADVILNDLTLDPISSFQALERFLSKLKPNGRVMMTVKLGDRNREDAENLVKTLAEKSGLEVEKTVPGEKREIFVFMRKRAR
ncbi:MAG: methyltransferase domain-containing protein [Candidatus Micrarchaeota archaeon]|nr:methyltransferase domain-containing protein [Candidatus Micrarchaeota archaeon]